MKITYHSIIDEAAKRNTWMSLSSPVLDDSHQMLSETAAPLLYRLTGQIIHYIYE